MKPETSKKKKKKKLEKKKKKRDIRHWMGTKNFIRANIVDGS